jgi:signal peptidase I
MKRFLKISSTAFIALLGVLAFAVVGYFFISKGNVEKAPSIFGYKPLTILSNSMQPTFDAGDIILINVDKEPAVNDVITYKHPDGVLVTHRAINMIEKDGKNLFESKGDNNEQKDSLLVSEENILGVQTTVIPYAGYVAKFAAGPVGFFLLVAVPLLAYLIIEIFQRLGLIGTKKREEQIQG